MADESVSDYLGGTSGAMRNVLELVPDIARDVRPLLIVGETGTGRASLARYIHHLGPRASSPFACVDASAIPAALLSSELFGVAGCASPDRPRPKSRLEKASGSTLYVPEIAWLPSAEQRRLDRTLTTGFAEPLKGGLEDRYPVDVRWISSVLSREWQGGRIEGLDAEFSSHLSATTIHVPALRDRLDDMPDFVRLFINKYNDLLSRGVECLDARVMTALASYSWPGNVRELENVVSRAVYQCRSTRVTVEEFERIFPDWDVGLG